MKIGALVLLRGTVLAAWHWPWSLTWRWMVCAYWHRRGARLGVYAQRTYCGGGATLVLNTPLVDVAFYSQPNMRRDKFCNYCH